MERQFLDLLVRRDVRVHGEPQRKDVQAARRRFDEAEAELEAWVNEPRAIALGDMYWTGMKSRRAAVDDARDALYALDADVDVPVLPGGGELPDVWETLTVPERRRLLALGIDAVMLRPGRVLDDRAWIFWRGQAPDDLPSRGRRVPLASFVWPVEPPVDAGVPVAQDRETKPSSTARRGRRRRRGRKLADRGSRHSRFPASAASPPQWTWTLPSASEWNADWPSVTPLGADHADGVTASRVGLPASPGGVATSRVAAPVLT